MGESFSFRTWEGKKDIGKKAGMKEKIWRVRDVRRKEERNKKREGKEFKGRREAVEK